MNKSITEPQAETKNKPETEVVDAMEKELTDEQLLQMAEGSSSWGANCNSGC